MNFVMPSKWAKLLFDLVKKHVLTLRLSLFLRSFKKIKKTTSLPGAGA